MRQIITVLLILASLSSFSQLQLGVKQNINAKGYVWKEGQFDSSFILPRDTFRVMARDSNAIAFKKGCLYVFSAGVWQILACAGGTIPTTPTYNFTVQPQSQTVAAATPFKENATFVGGTQPFNWTWKRLSDNATVSSSTNNLHTDTISVSGLAVSDAYQVSVSDATATVITSNIANVTVSTGSPSITYGYSSTDPFTNTSTSPAVGNPTTITTTHNADLSLTYPAAAVDKFLIVKVPATESAKVTWFVESANQGSIGDAAWRAAYTVSGFTYYVTRDAAGFTFNYTLPVQLKQ